MPAGRCSWRCAAPPPSMASLASSQPPPTIVATSASSPPAQSLSLSPSPPLHLPPMRSLPSTTAIFHFSYLCLISLRIPLPFPLPLLPRHSLPSTTATFHFSNLCLISLRPGQVYSSDPSASAAGPAQVSAPKTLTVGRLEIDLNEKESPKVQSMRTRCHTLPCTSALLSLSLSLSRPRAGVRKHCGALSLIPQA